MTDTMTDTAAMNKAARYPTTARYQQWVQEGSETTITPEQRTELNEAILRRIEFLVASRPSLQSELREPLEIMRQNGEWHIMAFCLPWTAFKKTYSADAVQQARSEIRVLARSDDAATKGGRAVQRGIVLLLKLIIDGAVKRGEIVR